jgi:hypothetical protein
MNDLKEKRAEMQKEAWVKNVMRIYPDKTKKETEALWIKLFVKKQNLELKIEIS